MNGIYTRSRIEVVITGRTRNAFALRGTRVRIPPSALSKYGHLEIFPHARISINTDCSTKSSTKYIFKLLCCCLPYRCIFVLFQIKDLLHCFCCIFFCIKFKIRISVGCCAEVAMSKPFLYLLHRYACSDEH